MYTIKSYIILSAIEHLVSVSVISAYDFILERDNVRDTASTKPITKDTVGVPKKVRTIERIDNSFARRKSPWRKNDSFYSLSKVTRELQCLSGSSLYRERSLALRNEKNRAARKIQRNVMASRAPISVARNCCNCQRKLAVNRTRACSNVSVINL